MSCRKATFVSCSTGPPARPWGDVPGKVTGRRGRAEAVEALEKLWKLHACLYPSLHASLLQYDFYYSLSLVHITSYDLLHTIIYFILLPISYYYLFHTITYFILLPISYYYLFHTITYFILLPHMAYCLVCYKKLDLIVLKCCCLLNSSFWMTINFSYQFNFVSSNFFFRYNICTVVWVPSFVLQYNVPPYLTW